MEKCPIRPEVVTYVVSEMKLLRIKMDGGSDGSVICHLNGRDFPGGKSWSRFENC